MKSTRLMAIAIVVLLAGLLALAAVAQEKTEVRQGEVISVDGQTLTFMENGVVKKAEIPAHWMFNVDGKQVPLSELKPGMKITATLTTKTVEVPGTQVVTIKNGEVVEAQANTIVVRQGTEYKKYTLPSTFKFNVGGEEVDALHLRKGMILNATIIVETPPVKVEEKALKLDAAAPPPPPPPAPAPAPEPEPAKLPKTGSPLPAAGLLGLLLVGGGACLTLFRRLA